MTFGEAGLYMYAIIVAVAFHVRVRRGEEPWLPHTHGAALREPGSAVVLVNRQRREGYNATVSSACSSPRSS